MHSSIFEIRTERIEREDWMTEDVLYDDANIDYVEPFDDEQRKEEIKGLVNDVLPQGMFTLVGDDVLVYNGGAEEWEKKMAAEIRKKAATIGDDIYGWSSTYRETRKLMNNPLDTTYRFVLWNNTISDNSYELMYMVSTLKEGEKLYVGAVFDYHI